METTVLINICELTKRYSGREILSQINLTIAQGEIHGLLGVSGAGKSTLLRCINGLETFDENGSVQVDGIEVQRLSPLALRQFRKKIGLIFQNFALLERRTAIENVMLPMLCWQKDSESARANAERLLDLVGIADKAHCRPAQLSGGQKQRVAIARALALEPKILLCDEATSALDPMTTKAILDLLKQINQRLGITIVMVTHQMDVVKYICDKASIIEHGRLTLTDTVRNVFTRPPASLVALSGHTDIELKSNEIAFKITLDNIEQSTTILLSFAELVHKRFRILFTQTDNCKAGALSHYTIAVDQSDYAQVMAYFKENRILFQKLAA
jgi:D-methionine transport system ATP-binding protein